MKFYQRFFSKVNFKGFSKARTKKFALTGGATFALAASLLVYASVKPADILVQPVVESIEVAAASEQTSAAAPLGLSRQRKDFEKALNILASAKDQNEALAEYYERVEKRVKGEALIHENGSGVRVVKARKKGAAAAQPESAPAGEASAPAQGASQASAWSKLKGFVKGAMSASNSDAAAQAPAYASDSAASSSVRASSALSSHLTVGDIAFNSNPAVERWVNYYTATQGGRRTMRIGIERSSSYLEMARAQFRALGVPEDLVWLAHVESVWHSGAMSPAAAGGIWQFIPRTATDYGLTVSAGYDERFDPVKQTRVAAEYLRDLHTIFGDWALAMAAYNCGEPRVMEAITKNGRANFWELHDKQLLPKETRNYVPKILAAISVASRAESYGFAPAYANESDIAGR